MVHRGAHTKSGQARRQYRQGGGDGTLERGGRGSLAFQPEPEDGTVEADGGFHTIDYIGGTLALLVVIGCILVGIRIILGAVGVW